MLHRRGERVLVGHDGAMPGFLAGLAVRRTEKVGAVVLANTSAAADPGGLAVDLALRVLDDDPDAGRRVAARPARARRGRGAAGPVVDRGHSLRVLRARGPAGGPAAPPRPSGRPRAWEEGRTIPVVSGAAGRAARVVRGPDGTVDRLYWATYPVTRDPRAFGA